MKNKLGKIILLVCLILVIFCNSVQADLISATSGFGANKLVDYLRIIEMGLITLVGSLLSLFSLKVLYKTEDNQLERKKVFGFKLISVLSMIYISTGSMCFYYINNSNKIINTAIVAMICAIIAIVLLKKNKENRKYTNIIVIITTIITIGIVIFSYYGVDKESYEKKSSFGITFQSLNMPKIIEEE